MYGLTTHCPKRRVANPEVHPDFAPRVQANRFCVLRRVDTWKKRRRNGSHRLGLAAGGRRGRVEKMFSGIQPEDPVVSTIVRESTGSTDKSGIATHVKTSTESLNHYVRYRFSVPIQNS